MKLLPIFVKYLSHTIYKPFNDKTGWRSGQCKQRFSDATVRENSSIFYWSLPEFEVTDILHYKSEEYIYLNTLIISSSLYPKS